MSTTKERTRLDQARQRITLCKMELEKAQKELAAAQHEVDVLNWKQVRDELRTATTEFEELEGTFRVAKAAVMPADNAMMRERTRLEQHRAKRPEEFDPEFAAWKREDARLEAEFMQARDAYSAAQTRCEQLRLAAVKAGNKVDGLSYAEQNARHKAKGVSPSQGWKGGLAGVV